MDKVTRALLSTFRQQQALTEASEDELFEHFSNFSATAQHFDDEFDVESIRTGGGSDLGIDGLAIIVNGAIVTSPDEVGDLVDLNGYLECSFIFVQAKTTSSFDGGSIRTFLDGVREFFEDEPAAPSNERICEARETMSEVYAKSSKMSRGKPDVYCYYVTTGQWTDDQTLKGIISVKKDDLRSTALFDTVEVYPYGAEEVQTAFNRTMASAKAEFEFASRTLIPDMPNIQEAYIGALASSEFFKIIEDDRGNIRKSLFVENVRDFLDSNPVNDKIASTLQSDSLRSNFAVLNNGVTIVTRSLLTTANKFHLSDFQIVNGCQTSHVLHSMKSSIDDSVTVPIKVIHTDDEDLISSIVTATNSQTTVTDEDLYARGEFQKNVEAFFAANDDPATRLYYERRARQYNSSDSVEKVRIVTKAQLIRAYAAMFLDDAHRASRYYSSLKALVGTDIFGDSHSPELYYSAAFAYYKLEYYFRNGTVSVHYKPARYHLLMAARHQAMGGDVPLNDRSNSRRLAAYCTKLNATLWNDQSCAELFTNATEAIEAAIPAPLSRDSFKTQLSTDEVLAQCT